MSQELAAKATLTKLDREHQAVITDTTMTYAEKALKSDALWPRWTRRPDHSKRATRQGHDGWRRGR